MGGAFSIRLSVPPISEHNPLGGDLVMRLMGDAGCREWREVFNLQPIPQVRTYGTGQDMVTGSRLDVVSPVPPHFPLPF